MRMSDWSSDVCSSDLDKVFASLAPKHDRARFRHAACGGDDLLLCINDIGQADGPAILDLVLYGLRRAAGHAAEDFRFQQLVAALQRHHQNLVLVRAEQKSEERRAGKACGIPCRTPWSTYHK